MVGPSMIPTIYTKEVYLRLRPLPNWINDIYQFIHKRIFTTSIDKKSSDDGNNNSVVEKLNYSWMKKYKVGDIVIIKDFKGMYACKRIIGVENDTIWKYGQYAIELYSNEDDFGVKDLGFPTASNNDNNNDNNNSSGKNGNSVYDQSHQRKLPSLPQWEDQHAVGQGVLLPRLDCEWKTIHQQQSRAYKVLKHQAQSLWRRVC